MVPGFARLGRAEVALGIEMHRRWVFQTQEELSHFLDTGAGLGRRIDRYSLRALFARRDTG